MNRTFNYFIILLMYICLNGCNLGVDKNSSGHSNWDHYGGSLSGSRFVKVTDIDKTNINDLREVAFYPTYDNTQYQFNPLVIDSFLYVLGRENSLICFNLNSEKEIWVHQGLNGVLRRGINYWESTDREDRRLILQRNDFLQEIDAFTGELIKDFGNNGAVDLRKDLGKELHEVKRISSGTPGVVVNNSIILGSSPGEEFMSAPGWIRCYDVITGKLKWTFHTIPLPGEYGYDTWPADAYKYIGGVNCWGEMTVDEDLEMVFIPLGSPTYDYYGGDRIGMNLFGNCIVALDINTGERKWHFQTVHHDLWDYDLAAAPQLVTIKNEEGNEVEVVAMAGKNGFLYVLDRENGNPIWPIDEIEFPQSDVPGEYAWPTQPIPSKIPPFSVQDVDTSDVSTFLFTLEERKEWKKKILDVQTGIYMPPSMNKETLALPGAVGGASVGSTAAYPEKGLVFIRNLTWPSLYGKVHKREKVENANSSGASNNRMRFVTLSQKECSLCHGGDMRGGVGPSLRSIRDNLKFTDFKEIVKYGKGDMPSFGTLTDEEISGIYNYLSFLPTGNSSISDLDIPEINSEANITSAFDFERQLEYDWDKEIFGKYGREYPESVDYDGDRYFIPDGWGLQYPYLLKPPWTNVVCYDLNVGEIIWSSPLGVDEIIVEENGGVEIITGVPRSQRLGMIVTSTGLLICSARDGHLYAFDIDSGEQLWAYELPNGTEGLMSMYSVGDKSFIVVNCTQALTFGKGDNPYFRNESPDRRGYLILGL